MEVLGLKVEKQQLEILLYFSNCYCGCFTFFHSQGGGSAWDSRQWRRAIERQSRQRQYLCRQRGWGSCSSFGCQQNCCCCCYRDSRWRWGGGGGCGHKNWVGRMSDVHRGSISNLGRLMKKLLSCSDCRSYSCMQWPARVLGSTGGREATWSTPWMWASFCFLCKWYIILLPRQVQSRCETCNCLVPDLVFDEHRQTCWAKSDTKQVIFLLKNFNYLWIWSTFP